MFIIYSTDAHDRPIDRKKHVTAIVKMPFRSIISLVYEEA